MKPFDLEAAKRGEPICDRDGNDVKIISYERNHKDNKLIGLYENGNVKFYTLNGKHYRCVGESNCDLFMKPVKKMYWINIYRSSLHITKHAADLVGSERRIDCIQIELDI